MKDLTNANDKNKEDEWAAGALTSSTENTVENPDPIKDIKDTFRLIKSGRMLYLMPIIVWSAISIAVFGGIFVPLMTRTMKNSGDNYPDLVDNKDKQNEAALIAMTLLGIGEIFGGGIIGQIRDRVSNKVSFIA